MKNKIFINIVVVLALALTSEGIMLDEQPPVKAAPTGTIVPAVPGSSLTTVKAEEARSAYQANGVSVDYVGHIGGQVYAGAVVGEFAYVGEGPSLTVLDISTPGAPSVISKSNIFPDSVSGVAVVGGYAYVMAGGLRVIDVSDPASPSEVGFCGSSGSAITIAGSFAYIANYGSGLQVIDVSDPTNPIEISSYKTPGYAGGVAVAGDYAYITVDFYGLRVIDVSNPTRPSEVGSYDPDKLCYDQGVAVAGSYAYVVDGCGLRIIDVSTPESPIEVGFYYSPGNAYGIAVAGGYAYVADMDSGLRVIDVSDPANPNEVGFYDTAGYALGVVVAEDYAYIADLGRGLRVINVSDPANPSEVGFYDAPSEVIGVVVVGDYAYISDYYNGLWVIDVSDPANPSEVSFYDAPGISPVVAVARGYAYMTDTCGLQVIDVSDPANLIEVGCYSIPGVAGDLAVAGIYAYLAGEVFRVLDVSDPASPSEVGSYNTPSSIFRVVVNENYAYVVDGWGGLRVIDVSDPANLNEVGSLYPPGSAWDIVVAGGYAYLAAQMSGLRVIDVSDPANLAEVGFYDPPMTGNVGGVAVAGGYATTVDNSSGGLHLIDIGNPANPSEVGSYITPGNANGVTVAGSYAYVADGFGGLIILHYTGLKAETMTNITSDAPDPTKVGEPIHVSFEVTASSGFPSGTVNVTVASQTASCTGVLAGGVGGCEITLNTPGTYSLLATYLGDNTFAGSSAVERHTVKYETAITILTDEPDPSQVGEPIAVTFEVTTGSGIPSGVITVTVTGEMENCTGTLSGGSGECEIRLNDPGTYTLTASYSGDDNYLPSSTTQQHTVVKGDTTTTILADVPDPSQVDQPILVTYKVAANTGVPSGTVTLSVAGQTPSCTGTLTNGVGGGEITFADPGIYTLMAVYSGDDHFLPSSATEQHMVVKGDTTTTILSDEPDPSPAGEPITITFQVTGGYGSPSGEVSVTVAGETESCTGTLAGGMGACQVTLDDPGTYTLTATYGGDNYFLSSSAVEQHTVAMIASTTTILSDDPDPSQVGQPFTVSFDVAASTGVPTGVVTVTVAGESESCTGNLADGRGKCEITLNDPGIYTLTVTYSGNGNFLPSSTAEEHQVVEEPVTPSAGLFLPLVIRK